MEFPLANYTQAIWSSHFWISLILVLIIRVCVGIWWTRRNLPPGPIAYPLIGNLLGFRGDPGAHEVMLELSKVYGHIMTIFLGSKPHIILNKYDSATEILSSAAFSGRPDSAVTRTLFGNAQNIVMGNFGLLWRLNKKAAAKCLRAATGAGKSEEKLKELVDAAVAKMLEEGVVKPELHAKRIVYNAISLVAFGKTYRTDDPEFLQLVELQDSVSKSTQSLSMFDFLPFVDYWPLKLFPSVRQGLGFFKRAKAFIEWQIYEHQRTIEKGNPRDFCDALLLEQELLEQEDDFQLTDQNIVLVLMDLFGAVDTMDATLTWFILFMVTHLQLQDQCYKAIKQVIGARPPRSSDRIQLPIVEACIMETLRLRPASPLGVPHAATSSAEIGDFSIPEGTAVITNIYAMHIDPDHWEKPLEFDPHSHFMDEDGQVKDPSSFAPFGFGRRSCLGEMWARPSLFLWGARLLQKIRFEPIEGMSYDTHHHREHYTLLKPLPYFVRAAPRE